MPKGLVIDQVKVSSGDKVKAGDVVATVTKTSVAETLLTVMEEIEAVEDEQADLSVSASDTTSSDYLKSLVLQSELDDLNKMKAGLNTLLESLTITAASDGIINTVTIASGDTVGQSSSTSSSSSSGSDSSGSNMQMSADQGAAYTFLTADLSTDEDTKQSADIYQSMAADTNEEITTVDNLDIKAPKTGELPQDKISIKDNGAANYSGSISWNISGEVFKGDTEYTATIVLNADEGYQFSKDVFVQLDNAYLVNWEVFGDAGTNRLRIVAQYEKTASEGNSNAPSGDETTEGSAAAGAGSGDGSSSAISGDGITSAASGGGSSSASASSAGASSSAGSSESSSSESSDVNVTSTESTVATISSSEKMQVSINVDELDILSVASGQETTITLDAIEDKEFEGTVKSVSQEASSSSGNSSSTKYVVNIELNREDNMLLGMSASATISIDEAKDAILIPVAAVQEEDGESFIYTTKEEDGTLSGKVEVTTGLSDGSNVEITKGLSSGDTIYYMTTESSSESAGESGMGGGQMMPGGSEAPDMSNMPDRDSMPSGGQAPGGGNRSSN